MRVQLEGPTGRVGMLVQRAVLLAHVGPCPEGMEARHYPSREKTDNRLVNLSWAPHEVNIKDKYEHGGIAEHSASLRASGKLRGANSPRAKLCDGDAIIISMLCALPTHERPTNKEIGQSFRVTPECIGHIDAGRNWSHATGRKRVA